MSNTHQSDVPVEAEPYLNHIEAGSAAQANVAAINAVEACAQADEEPEAWRLEALFSKIGDETTLTKTVAKDRYSELRAERTAEEINAERMTIVEAEGDDEADHVQIVGRVADQPFRIFGELGAVERGAEQIRTQLLSVVMKHRLDVEVPRGGEWIDLFQAWYSDCRDRDAIEITTEAPERPAHDVAESFLNVVARKHKVDAFEAWDSARDQSVFVPREDGVLQVAIAPFGLLGQVIEQTPMDVAAREVTGVLRDRGYLREPVCEARDCEHLPAQDHMRVLVLDADTLVSEGLLDPDAIDSEVLS